MSYDEASTTQEPRNTMRGAQWYTPFLLKAYDFWVLRISATFAWRCSTLTVLEPFFNKNLGQYHLDVGVGTGYFPSAALNKPLLQDQDDTAHTTMISLTLADLSPSALQAATQRVSAPYVKIQSLVLDVLDEKLPEGLEVYDSISLYFLMHCLPGPTVHKAMAFRNLKQHLKSNGTLFGATVLGDDAGHNLFGKALMWFYNWAGIFDNRQDSATGLVAELRENFDQVEWKVVGTVFMFRAWQPI